MSTLLQHNRITVTCLSLLTCRFGSVHLIAGGGGGGKGVHTLEFSGRGEESLARHEVQYYADYWTK